MFLCPQPTEKFRENDIVIALVGLSGVGKSRFIDLLDGGKSQRAGDGSMKSKTTKIKAVRVERVRGDGMDDRIVLIDTPGLNVKNQSDILKDIRSLLNKSNDGLELSGILFLHRITDNRIDYNKRGNSFKELVHACGHKNASERVMVVTTHWPLRRDLEFGCETRERDLQEKYWAGSRVERLPSESAPDAWGIVDKVIALNNPSS